jgi:riboflavin synthase
MYSGITRGLFDVTHVEKKPGLTTYRVKLNDELLQGLTIGASVSIDGVCQTVTAIKNNEVTFQAMEETLQRTTLNDLYEGRKVSVETSLRYGDVIGGHEMAGHVIGTAKIIDIEQSENNLGMTLQIPKEWMNCIFTKGFIAIDGSSLTVGEINPENHTFNIHLIPETLRVTNFKNKKIGDRVNIELDFKIQTIVKTVENFLKEKKTSLDISS